MLECARYGIKDAPEDYWDFVHNYGSIYQTKPYLSFEAALSRDPVILAVYDDGEIVGGTAVTVGCKILHLRNGAGVMLGPVVKDAASYPDVFKLVARKLKEMSIRYTVDVPPEYAEILRSENEIRGWYIREVEYLLWDISVPIDDIVKALPKGKKAAIKRARREGVIIEEIKTEAQIEQFHSLYVKSMTKEVVQAPNPVSYYKTQLRILGKEGMMTGFLALHPETKQPIAAVTLLLGLRGEALYWAVGHDYEFRKYGSTDLLVLHCVEYLKSRNFHTFNLLGLPQHNTERARGVIHFKTAWAAHNGRRMPAYILSRGIFCLPPGFIEKNILFLKRIFNR